MKSDMEISPCVNFVLYKYLANNNVKLSFLSKYSSTFFGFALLPNIISVCEKPKEVAFSLLNHLITSEKNCLVQEQFWRVWIIESFIWQYLHSIFTSFP